MHLLVPVYAMFILSKGTVVSFQMKIACVVWTPTTPSTNHVPFFLRSFELFHQCPPQCEDRGFSHDLQSIIYE
ncbi:hypothetical protein BDV23DRAFT_158243 [Aspergillus alliaceus]|uniref:Secreted protein n=1 Tax=Petromyces alliaceus TaxID=209559 RepID=A0A5N7C432_PETAA|nr:hypothetical protein BDV23DRAFT_158243 [Aspergillus alliaceus]